MDLLDLTGSVTHVLFSAQPLDTYVHWYVRFLKKNEQRDVLVIDRSETDADGFFEQASMSFLGQSRTIVVKDTETSAHDLKKFDAYLKAYTGPNTIILFTQRALYQKQAHQLPELVTRDEFTTLAKVSTVTLAPVYVDAVFAHKKSYTWDAAYLLLHYGILIGQRTEVFFNSWYHRICKPEQSLFALSGHFFARDIRSFLKVWYAIKPNYTVEFWVSFWSEQFWQALIFIECAQQGSVAQGKKLAYRLPFSFFQKDYRRYSSKQLAALHERLYRIDHDLKNGREGENALTLLLVQACLE